MTTDPALFGIMAEFETADAILTATRVAWQTGYRDMDAYTPYCVEGLATALGQKKSQIPAVAFIGGLVGAGAGFFMQMYTIGVDYPLNVGGRPYNSWPFYVPIAFEVLVLVASLATAAAMIALNGLPRLHHPVFNVPGFDRASQDRFFLCIEATDAMFDRDQTAHFLLGLSPSGDVVEVPREQLVEPADVGAEARPEVPVKEEVAPLT
jgi:hypothetical protein